MMLHSFFQLPLGLYLPGTLPQVNSQRRFSGDKIDDKAVQKRARQHLQNLMKEVMIKRACFEACQTGFTVSGYIQASVDAELSFSERDGTDVRSPTDEIPKDTPHPELYLELLKWRHGMAEELDRPLHEILPTRSLQEVVRVLPADRISLKKIPGIGKAS